MSTLHRGYEPAVACTGGPTRGARALMSWLLGAYGGDGARNLGIYNCRGVVGAPKTRSLHAEGRALDLGVEPHGAAWGSELAELLRTHSGPLGIQLIIWDRRYWSGSYPEAGWRAYRGQNPHIDHLHIELSRDAADTLSAPYIDGVLSPQTAAGRMPRRTLYVKSGGRMHGEDVAGLQRGLLRVFPSYARLSPDGWYGPSTERTIKEFQRRSGLEPDGVVGPATWAALARFGI